MPSFLPTIDAEYDDDAEREVSRRSRALDARLYAKLREVFLQFLHLVLLAIICYDNRTSTFFQQNKAINDLIPLDFAGGGTVGI